MEDGERVDATQKELKVGLARLKASQPAPGCNSERIERPAFIEYYCGCAVGDATQKELKDSSGLVLHLDPSYWDATQKELKARKKEEGFRDRARFSPL